MQNYDAANLKIADMLKNSKFEAFLNQCKDNPENKKNLTLESYLIQPVQRTMRYELLLRELLKHTWPDHPDYDGLTKAIEKVHQMAELLNLRKREGENNRELVNIDNNLIGKPKDLEMLLPTRRFISKHIVKTKSGPTTVIICSDIVLVCRGEDKLKFVDYAPIGECDFLPLEDAKKKGKKEGFDFEVRKWGVKKPIAVCTVESEDIRKKIIDEVNDASEKWRENSKLHKEQIRTLSSKVESTEHETVDDGEKSPSLTPEKQLLERKKEK